MNLDQLVDFCREWQSWLDALELAGVSVEAIRAARSQIRIESFGAQLQSDPLLAQFDLYDALVLMGYQNEAAAICRLPLNVKRPLS